MKTVIAIDSLKGSLSSLEAGDAIRTAICRVQQNADVVIRPLADGGEGTVEALTHGMGGALQTVSVTGPLGEPVRAVYGIVRGDTAVIEMSAAAGLTLVDAAKRNPLYTTTYGVGELIRHAIGQGCRRFIVGIGGSATNDGGVGMLQALGYGMLDHEGRQVPFGAMGVKELATITQDEVLPELRDCAFRIACDVTNPLCGTAGCSAVFGPQKGATPAMITAMDGWLKQYAALAGRSFSRADPQRSGTGAAGGLGFAFLTFTNAVLESGIQIVLDETRLEDYVKTADLVITGEGRIDGQTVMGKAPIGVAAMAKKYGKPVVAFAGCVTPAAKTCNEHGIDAYFPILQRTESLAECLKPETARQNMIDTVEQVFRLLATAIHTI